MLAGEHRGCFSLGVILLFCSSEKFLHMLQKWTQTSLARSLSVSPKVIVFATTLQVPDLGL